MLKISSDDRYKEIIKREMAKLKKPVKLRVFTSQGVGPDGTQLRVCMDCGEFMTLLRIYEENSNDMLTIEELSLNDNPEFTKKYDINRVPTILFIDDNGREIIRYLGLQYNKKKGINKNSTNVQITAEMKGTYLRGKQITRKSVNP